MEITAKVKTMMTLFDFISEKSVSELNLSAAWLCLMTQ